MKPRFYVYCLEENGLVIYVGKGSGYRLTVQRRKFGCPGRVLAWFDKEKDAYLHEIKMIAELKPGMNKHPGGNGQCARKIRQSRREKWEIEYDKIGGKAYSARILLRYFYLFNQEMVDKLNAIANW